MATAAIDIHHHYIPYSLLEEAKRHGEMLGVKLQQHDGREMTLSFAGGARIALHPNLAEVEPRFAMMQDGKITMAVLEAHTASLGYRLDGERGEQWCRLYNDGLADLVRRHPDRFVAIAAVPLQDPSRAARVLEHAVNELKMRGALIGSNVNGRYYDSREFDPFWRKAEELDVIIVMHPEDVAGSERMGPYGLRLICGNPADSTLSLGYLAYGGVFDRFPKLKLCVLHGGGFFPYQVGRFDQGFVVGLGAPKPEASTRPSAYLKNLYFDNLVYQVENVESLKRIVGTSHLMVGTDYPYELGDWLAAEKIEFLDCPEAEKSAMLAGNARRLFRI